MAQFPGLEKIEQAIIDAIKADVSLNWLPPLSIKTSERENFNLEQGSLAIAAPAILVQYVDGTFSATNIQKTVSAGTERFNIVIVALNLRGPADTKRGNKGAYEMRNSILKLFMGNLLSFSATENGRTEVTASRYLGIDIEGRHLFTVTIEVQSIWVA